MGSAAERKGDYLNDFHLKMAKFRSRICAWLVISVPNHSTVVEREVVSWEQCEDRVLDGPASGEKGSKGRN